MCTSNYIYSFIHSSLCMYVWSNTSVMLLSPMRCCHVVDPPPVDPSDRLARVNKTDGNKSSGRRRRRVEMRCTTAASLRKASEMYSLDTTYRPVRLRASEAACSCAMHNAVRERAWRVQFSLQLSPRFINPAKIESNRIASPLLTCHLQCPWLRARAVAPARSRVQTSIRRQGPSQHFSTLCYYHCICKL